MPSPPPLRIREVDGNPSRVNVTELIFPNGTLTANGSSFSFDVGSLGGGNVTGTNLTSGKAIIGAGSGNIAASKLTITDPATGATLTVSDNGSLITAGGHSITLTSTGATNVTFPTSGTLATRAGSETFTNKTLTSPVINVGSDATGDIYYRNSGGSFTRLGVGTDGQVLTLASGLPSWATGGGGSGDMVLASVQTVTGKKTFGTIGGAVGKFALAGSTSGSTILDAAAVAGSGTVVLPTTGTLATLAGSETFTNKTLTSPVINVGSDATGDIYYRNSGGAFTRLGVGTDGQVLTLASGLPSWAAGGGSVSAPLTLTISDTNNSIVVFPLIVSHTLSSTTAAANIGVGINYTIEADGDIAYSAGTTSMVWTSPVDGTQTSDYVLRLSASGTIAEKFRITSASALQITGASPTIATLTSNADLALAPNGTGRVVVPDGTAAKPGIVFNGATTSGIYRRFSTATSFSAGGTLVAEIASTGIAIEAGAMFGWGIGGPNPAINRVAAGVMEVNNGTAGGLGKLLYGRVVTAKTSDYTVLAADKHTFFTNTGAAGSVNFSLPTAASGLIYEFYRDANQTVQITAAASTTIRVGTSVTAAAGNVTLDAVGSRIRLVAISTTQWVGDVTGGATFT